MIRTLNAVLAAVVVQPLVFAAWYAVPVLLSDNAFGDLPWQEIAMLLSFVAIFALAFVVVLGIPAFHLLRRWNAARPRNLAIVGFVCAALPVAALTWPSACAGCSSSATWHGRYVELETVGHVTLYGWLNFLEGVLQFGLHGLIGALVFGFVWTRTSARLVVDAVPVSITFDQTGSSTLPPDLQRCVAKTFAPDDRATACALLQEARIETGAAASDHLLRCAAYASHGDVARLRKLVAMLAIDWRDVVVAGECEMRDGRTVHVRDLTKPFPR